MKDEHASRRLRRTERLNLSSFILPPSSLLRFLMISVFTATATELAELKPIRRGFLILGRYVVAALTVNTLKHNIIAWHLLISDPMLSPTNFSLSLPTSAHSTTN
jgi:hypothetical protein